MYTAEVVNYGIIINIQRHKATFLCDSECTVSLYWFECIYSRTTFIIHADSSVSSFLLLTEIQKFDNCDYFIIY